MLSSLKVNFIDEILDVINGANFLKAFHDKFEIFITKRHDGKFWRRHFFVQTLL